MVFRNSGAVITVVVYLFAVHAAIAWHSALHAADAPWGENLLQNPSFESGKERLPDGWKAQAGASVGGGESRSQIERDSDERRDGKRSVRIHVEAGDQKFDALVSQPVDVEAGKRYRLSGWMKTRGVRRVGRQFLNCNLYVAFQDAEGKPIRVGRYPVVGTRPVTGTNDWTQVERIVRAPAGAAKAVVGCFLSCSGVAWFDAVSFRPQSEVSWERVEAERFVFYFEKGDRKPTRRDILGNERNLKSLEKLLGVRHPEKIDFYKYRSRERKGQITGVEGNAHVEEGAIHSIFWADRHEIVHVLTNRGWTADTIALFGEGLAVYLSGAWRGKKVHAAARDVLRQARRSGIGDLVDTARFRSESDLVTYPLAGSFVGFLVERHGMERFKKVYEIERPGITSRQLSARLEKGYGKSLEEIEAEWLAYLGLR